MSDAAQNLDEQPMEQEVDWQEKATELESRLNSVLAKHDQLLNETKKAKAVKKEAEAKELEARKEQENLAAKNGEFEKLFKQRDKEYHEAVNQIDNLKKQYRQEKIDVMSMNLANDLADGSNAKLLSKFISESLSNLADETGALGDDVLASVKSEYKSDETYKALLRQSKAQGGGAPGNMRGAQETTTLTKSEFNKLNPSKQHEFLLKKGGKVIEE